MSPLCSPVCSGVRKAVVCVLLLSGLCSCLHNFYYVNQGKTWQEAQSYCRNKYTDLATINNNADMRRLEAAAGSGFGGTVWIGLHDIRDWRWTMDGHKMVYSSWKEGAPNNRKHTHICVYYQYGKWIDSPCDTRLMFVCFNGTRDGPSFNGNYVFITEILTRNKALAYCKANYTDLAIVTNQAQNNMVQQVIRPHDWVWIGLNRLTWRWSYGTSNFRSWAGGHPKGFGSGNCVSMNIPQGTWVEKHCDTKMHFMCQSNKKRMFRIKLTALQTTIDLNDHKVKDAILNMMREKLKERGLLKDVRIGWVKKPGLKIFHKEV